MDKVKALFESGELHHITYRNRGTLWEGFWIYKRDPNGFRGFTVAGHVGKDDADFEAVERFCLENKLGIHVGSFGNG